MGCKKKDCGICKAVEEIDVPAPGYCDNISKLALIFEEAVCGASPNVKRRMEEMRADSEIMKEIKAKREWANKKKEPKRRKP
jgi:hypothetical protein